LRAVAAEGGRILVDLGFVGRFLLKTRRAMGFIGDPFPQSVYQSRVV